MWRGRVGRPPVSRRPDVPRDDDRLERIALPRELQGLAIVPILERPVALEQAGGFTE